MFHLNFDVHLINVEVSFAIDSLMNASNAHNARTISEIAMKWSAPLHRNEQNSTIDEISTGHVEMGKFQIEWVFWRVLDDADGDVKSYWISYKKKVSQHNLAHFNVLMFQLEAPNALMSRTAIVTPWPVLLPGTISSPSSIGSSDGISYSGIPETSFGFNSAIDFSMQSFKSGSVWRQTCRKSAESECIH